MRPVVADEPLTNGGLPAAAALRQVADAARLRDRMNNASASCGGHKRGFAVAYRTQCALIRPPET